MKLNDKHIEVIAKTTLEFLKAEELKNKKQKYDRRVRNIKLLLRNYRSFAIHCNDIKLDINKLNQKLELDDIDTDEFAIESIIRSKERTLAIVKFINQMLEIYRIICEKSGKDEEIRKYKSIYFLYLADERMTAEDIARLHCTNKRTVYKDIDNACKALSALVFGVDGLYF